MSVSLSQQDRSCLRRLILCLVTLLGAGREAGAQVTVERYGSGTNEFSLEYVTVGNAGNEGDPAYTLPPGRAGAVGYDYRMGKCETAKGIVRKADAEGNLLISYNNAETGDAPWGEKKPATNMSFYEVARFANWLNLITGHPPAYRFDEFGNWQLWTPAAAWQKDGENLYRHKDSFYFLPSNNEWHKAAYYNPLTRSYSLYPTGSDTIPTPVAGGAAPGTAVYQQPTPQGPADVDSAGGLSPYGTMAQGGNLWDWIETAYDGVNDRTDELIGIRGGRWFQGYSTMRSKGSDHGRPWDGNNDSTSFRIAALPEIQGDTDGDGMSDADEHVAGTDPNAADDVLRLTSLPEGSGVIVEFKTQSPPVYDYMEARRFYALEESSDPAVDPWRPVPGFERIPGLNQPFRQRLEGMQACFYRVRVWLEAGMSEQRRRGNLSADTFGTDTNSFRLDFVEVGDPGNPKDAAAGPYPLGGVDYRYRIGKYEVSEDQINKANRAANLNITLSSLGPDKPATMMDFYERARFVNWLNTSRGYSPAYNLDAKDNWQLWPAAEAWTEGGTNQYRHKDAFYFLPSADEWHKAAFYDGFRYYKYATRSDLEPIPVAAGRVGGTVVYGQPAAAGAVAVSQAGGLSHYGTMAQTGNVSEFIETAYDGVNDATDELLQLRGGLWSSSRTGIVASGSNNARPWSGTTPTTGFRVAARIPAQ